MVKIKKGKLTLTVPAGAVRKYTSAGWELAGISKSEVKVTKPTTPHANTNEDETADDTQLEDESTEEEVEYVDPEELAQRPLSELDREELRILAEYKGIDVSEMTSTKQLRNTLRSLE